MAVPFKSTVFTGGSFAASGSNGHSSAGLLIYSASRSTSGLLPAADLANIGKDVFLFVSGVVGSRGTTSPGAVVLGGDLIISGTAYYSDGTSLGAGGSSAIYFTSPQAGVINTTGSITANGSLTVSGSTILGDASSDSTTVAGSLTSAGVFFGRSGLQASGSSGVTGSLVIKDDTGNTAQLTLSSSAGSVAFDYYSDGNLYVTNNKVAGEVWFSTTQPDTVGSQFLRVKPQNGGRNLVLFNNGMSGGSAANAENSSDTSFFVSGIVSSRGTATRGTAVFGGDLYVSGTVFSNEFKSTIISSSIIYSSGSTRFGDSADDTHTFTGGITGSDLRLSGDLAVNGGDITSTALSPTLFNTSNNNDVEIGRHLTSLSIADQTTGTGFTMNVGQNRSGNFTLNMGNAVATGATKTVNIATNAGVGSLTNITLGSDTAGTAGTTFLKTPKVEISGRAQVTGSLVAPFITGSLTQLVNGTSYLAAGSNVTITTGSSGQVTISSTGGAASVPSYFSSTTNTAIFTTGSAAFVGTGNEAPGSATAVDAPTDKGSDVYFYVSGSTAGKGTSNGKVALYGGHLVVSGSQYVSGTSYIGQAGAYLGYTQGYGASVSILNAYSPDYINVTSVGGTTFYPGGTFGVLGNADIQLAVQGASGLSVLNSTDTDPTKYLLKITDPLDLFTPTIDFGNSSSGTSQFNFYGEIYSRELIRAATSIVVGDTVEARVVTASYGLTGSLTRLSDGRSYLAAGTNVTITSESNGQITISSTGGGGGTPAGSNTYVQFNDSGSFGASSGLAFEKATNTLSGVTINASTGFSGSHTKLANGTSLIAAGVTSTTSQTGSIAVTTGSTGQITVSSYVFPSDLTVSLTGGRTFGRYATGETIPAAGKTPAEVILLAIAQPISPTVATPTATNILTSVWNTTGSVNTSLTGSYTINTLGASVASARLEFRSGSSGAWSILTTSTSTPLLYDHTFTVGTNFTSTLNYNHIVVDSAGAVATGSVTLSPQTYASPTVSAITLARTTLGGITGESNTTRERGNTVSAITGTITRQRTNAPLSSYAVQYRVNTTGGYTGVPGLSGSIPAASSSFTFTGLHNEAALLTSVTSALDYIVSVVDTWQTSSLTPSGNAISFLSAIFYGTGSAAPTTSTDVRNLPNKVFTSTANPFTLNTGATNRFFTVALPTRNTTNDNITSVTDTDALGADITANYVNSAFNVADGGGVNSIYNVYTMEVATPYASDHRHVVTRA